jgi:hypothetical protein
LNQQFWERGFWEAFLFPFAFPQAEMHCGFFFKPLRENDGY